MTIPSDLPLDNFERSVLGKGLGFVPTNRKPEKFQCLEDLSKFYRKIRLHAFFNNLDQTVDDRFQAGHSDDDFCRFQKSQSSFTPREGQFEAVDRFIGKCRQDISMTEFSVPKRSNITDDEEKALKTLRQRKDIIIKPADKGGAVVVWRRDLYEQEAENQLSNEQFYTRLEGDRTEEISKTIKSEIQSMIGDGNLSDTAVSFSKM